MKTPMLPPAREHKCRWCGQPSGDQALVLEAGHYVHPQCTFCPENYPICTVISFPGGGKTARLVPHCTDCGEETLLEPGEVVCPRCKTDRNEARAYRLTSTGKTLQAVR